MIIVSTTTETLYYLWHKITNTIPIKIHAFMYNKWLDSANEIKWILGNLGSFVKKREGNIGSSNTYNWVIDILLFMFGMCLVYICAICCVFCLYWSGIWATSHFQINIHNLMNLREPWFICQKKKKETLVHQIFIIESLIYYCLCLVCV
jgi:hypothetical protein